MSSRRRINANFFVNAESLGFVFAVPEENYQVTHYIFPLNSVLTFENSHGLTGDRVGMLTGMVKQHVESMLGEKVEFHVSHREYKDFDMKPIEIDDPYIKSKIGPHSNRLLKQFYSKRSLKNKILISVLTVLARVIGKYQTRSSLLADIYDFACNVTSRLRGNVYYAPGVTLAVRMEGKDLEKGIEALNEEIEKIASFPNLIQGHLLAPSVIELSNPVGNGLPVYAVVAILHLYPLAGGFDYVTDKRRFEDFLKEELLLDYVAQEGGISVALDKEPYSDWKINKVFLLGKPEDARTSERP